MDCVPSSLVYAQLLALRDHTLVVPPSSADLEDMIISLLCVFILIMLDFWSIKLFCLPILNVHNLEIR